MADANNDNDDSGQPRPRDVRRRFDAAAPYRDGADFLARATGDALMERLLPVTVEADWVLDLGAGSGGLTRALSQRFRGARVINLDLSRALLREAAGARPFLQRRAEVQANAAALPLRNDSVDVVVSNLLLPWVAAPPAVFAEAGRVLRRDGVFAFAALGPDSLAELRDAFGDDGTAHVRRFPDMHDLGDALVRAGLRDPVLDVERLDVNYRDPDALFRDLTAGGGRNTLAGRRRTLTGKRRFARFRERFAAQFCEQGLDVTLELVFGHAWGGDAPASGGEVRVDINRLRGSRRR